MIGRRTLPLLISACLAADAGAQALTGEATIGWRSVDVDGSQAKYAEDINLDDGPRVFDARLAYDGGNAEGAAPDAIAFEMSGLGGDPYERFRIDVRKYGAYRFTAGRQRSDYVYDDIIVLPENASISGSTGGDFHRFDFERVRDDAALTVDLNARATAEIGFDRYARRGDSTTTLDVARDEFELERPIDEERRVFRAGVTYRWDRLTVSLEERYSEFENHTELLLPGFSLGANPADTTTLDFYFLDQPYEFDSLEHVVRVHARPTDRLGIRVAAMVSELDLDAIATERSQGVDFTGAAFTTDIAGGGGIGRDGTLIDADGTYAVSDRLQLTLGLRRHELEQAGDFSFGSAEGGASEWDIDNTAVEVGATWAASDTVVVSAGWSAQRRDVRIAEAPAAGAPTLEEVRTDSDGFFGAVSYRPGKGASVNFSIDQNDIDDPFSLAAPTDSTRYRLRGRYRFGNGLALSAAHTRTELENPLAAWTSETRETAARVTYAGRALTVSAGVTIVDVSRDFERRVRGGFREDLFRVFYDADTDYLDATARWRVDARWTVGAALRLYDNGGSFNVKRDDAEGYAEYGLTNGYAIRGGYRYINFAEGGIEDYDTDIVEVAIRLSF